MGSLLTKIKTLFGGTSIAKPQVPRNRCYFCKKKHHDLRKYKNEFGQTIKVCPLCVNYAERRAYFKK